MELKMATNILSLPGVESGIEKALWKLSKAPFSDNSHCATQCENLITCLLII